MNISGIWTLEELRKGVWSKLELQKAKYFSKNLLHPLSRCRLFPKSTFKECGGPGR